MRDYITSIWEKLKTDFSVQLKFLFISVPLLGIGVPFARLCWEWIKFVFGV